MIDIKFILYTIFAIIIIHFILYFFNIDFFELFEKKNTKIQYLNHKKQHSNHKEIEDNINDLENSLEELKEITTH